MDGWKVLDKCVHGEIGKKSVRREEVECEYKCQQYKISALWWIPSKIVLNLTRVVGSGLLVVVVL